jgi:predicted NBD/HSP70 family sugar kinase
MPVLCTSGVVAAAREGQWSGRISSPAFVYVHLAAEIRCAIITHGQLCTGANGRGGDIAHTPAVMGGEPCTCGRRGCLHAVLAEQGLRRVFATALAFAQPPTLEEIARLAASDDEAAVAVEAVATYLADALLSAVPLLDPEIVVIGGRSADALGETFRSVLQRCVTDRNGGGPGPAVQRARDGAGGAASAASRPLRVVHTGYGPPRPGTARSAADSLPVRPGRSGTLTRAASVRRRGTPSRSGAAGRTAPPRG